MKNIVLSLCLSSLFVSACSNKPDKLADVLNSSGENRKELAAVISHYSQYPKDSLKLKAAIFLIENMTDKHSIIPDENDPYLQVIKKRRISEPAPWDPQRSNCAKIFDSISMNSYGTGVRQEDDSKYMTSTHLIENIELAFQAWENIKPHLDYSFDVFCEYVLPYRIDDEALTDWRRRAYHDFVHLVDSLADPFKVFAHIKNKTGMRYNAGMSSYPYPLTFEDIRRFRWGDCVQIANYITLALRSVGIPASNDMVPAWANRSSSHAWNSVMDSEGKFSDLQNTLGYRVSKIYRKRFSINENYLSTYEDVTHEYDMPLTDVVLKSKRGFDNAYLCTFNNQNWVPIAGTKKENRKYTFKNMGRGIVNKNKHSHFIGGGKGVAYLPVVGKSEKELYSLFDPIILYEDGRIRTLKPNMNKMDTITISRKYPKAWQLNQMENNMVGGRFEISKDSLFAENQLIYKSTERSPHPTTRVQLENPVKIKYIRYLFSEKIHGRMILAELAFYNNDSLLEVEPIYSNPNMNDANLRKIVDRNTETSVYGIKAGYVGFKFPEMSEITHLEYTRYVGGNDVNVGQDYELFYWDKKWVSLGFQTATRNSFTYNNVPSEALLLLKNHTKGVEERIFTYENGKQVWW